MNTIGLWILLFFGLFSNISNRVMKITYSEDHKYCFEKEPSFSGFIDNTLNAVTGGLYGVNEILEIFNGKNYDNYDEWKSARRKREKEFRKVNPLFQLRNYMEQNKLNCALYDKMIEIFDDGSIVETPYNFRPLS